MSAETTQQLTEVQSLREMLKNQALMGIRPITGIFSCIICKSTITTTSNLVVAPCCQTALACRDCLEEWLSSTDNHTCPNCREPIDIEQCSPMPVIRPLIAALANGDEPTIAGDTQD